jgi:protocatechuate 3,4-dioxygenase beta subunit
MKIILFTAFLIISTTAFGQKTTVSGNLTDDNGEPIIGAIVTVK